MDNIIQAIASAADARPLDFKNFISAELQSRVHDALLNQKVEVAGTLMNNTQIEDNSEEEEFHTSSEENVDEDL
jgi:hypothetical protein